MLRQDLERMSREQLIAEAERLGIPRPRVLTLPELIDEIIGRTAKSERERAKARGWLGRARDLLSRVVERGLHLPEAARVLRREGEEKGWPAPPPPLPTVTLAEIYAAQGHLERAIAVLDEVIAREPDHREAKQMRERFVEQQHRSRARKAGEKDAPPSSAPTKSVKREEPKLRNSQTVRDGEGSSLAEAQPLGAPEASSPTAVEKTSEQEGATPSVVATVGEQAGVDPLVASQPDGDEEASEPPVAPTVGAEEGVEASVAPTVGEEEGAEPADEAAVLGEAATERAPVLEEPAEALEEPPLPDRYEVDEIVAIAVDPRTIYLYWEVRPTTLAHAQSERPEGFLCVRVVSVVATWEGPRLAARDLRVDALYGDRFLRDIQPGSNVRVSVGWKRGEEFFPFAVGAEVTAPRAVPVETVAQEVARFEADPVVAPFQHRGPQPVFAPVFVDVREAMEAQVTRAVDVGGGAVMVERVERVIASRGHGAPVDTGVESFAEGPRGAGEAQAEEEIVESAWFHRGGSSELSRGGPGRIVRRRPEREAPIVFGGASELSR
jgi:hypothetical protein